MADETPNLHQHYLGDGLYVEYDGYQIRLWTDRFPMGQHEIFLEPNVLANFMCYVEMLKGGPIET